MRLLRLLGHRLGALLQPRRRQRQLDEELQLHIELEAAALERERGLSPAEARAAALRAFGGVARYRDEARDARGLRALDDGLRDLRVGMRAMLRRPAFAIVVIGTLGLGVGATTAVFSAVHHILLAPLPYANADRVLALWHHDRASGEARREVAAGNFLDWRERAGGFAHLAAAEPYGLDWVGPDGPVYFATSLVSEGYFGALGVRPLLGRGFVPEEHTDGGNLAVVLSHGVWRERFGGDSTLIGRTMVLDGDPRVVVGVMPPGIELPRGTELWAPKVWRPNERESRRATYFSAFGRLRDGVSRETAQAELDAIAAQLASEHPATNENVGVRLVPLSEHLTGPVRNALLVLFGAVFFVLLIACANVANLQLARAMRRHREFALRTALGASRGRVVRQLLVESVVLALAGTAVGIAVAWGGVAVIRALAPEELPRIASVSVDGVVFVFALLLALLTAMTFGVLPALRVFRRDARAGLAVGSRTATVGRSRRRLSGSLVTAEVALAVMLLVGAGLLVRSFAAILAVDSGLRVRNVAAFTYQAWSYYPTPEHRTAFVRMASERLAAVPGVQHVGVTSSLPLTSPIGAERAQLAIPGESALEHERPAVHVSVITPGYLEALEIPLVDGRLPAEDGTAPEALVSETLARQLWPGENPIGRTLTIGYLGPPRAREVVGVVGDVRHDGPQANPRASVFLPYAQAPSGAIHLVVRGTGDARQLTRPIVRELHAINGAMPLAGVTTMEELLDDAVRERRFHLALLGSFAVLALVLAAIGLYGVMSQTVGEREQEIGIRMAVGARRTDILGLLMRDGMRYTGVGAVLGVGGAIAVTRVLRAQLHDVAPLDPVTFAASLAILLAVAAVAAGIPARRGARVNPISMLRSD